MIRIGCHLSSSKGYESMAKDAIAIDANTFQFFTRNPRGGNAKAINEKDVERFLTTAKEKDITPLLAHAPYTLNACSADPKLRDFAKRTMADDLARMEYTPGNMYNFHPGCHVKQGVKTGIEYISQMLNEILSPDQTTTAIAPLFILWFGYSIWSKVLVTILITFFPIAITVFDGFKATKREMEELLQTYGATKADIFWKLKLPTALPNFFSAIKMAIPLSVIGAAIAEWLGAQEGLGYFSKRMMTQLDGAGVFAPVVLLSITAMLAVGIITVLEYRFIKWRKEI